MRKNKLIAVGIICTIIIVIISSKYMSTINNGQLQNDKQNTSVENDVQAIRKDYSPTFTSKNKIFLSEMVEVSQKQYTGNLCVVMNGENIDNSFSFNIYDDDNVIYNGKNSEQGAVITIPYKLNEVKGKFKLEVICTKDLKNNDELTPQIVWYVNRLP